MDSLQRLQLLNDRQPDGRLSERYEENKMNYWTRTGFGIDQDDISPLIVEEIAFLKKFLPEKYEEMETDAIRSGIDMSDTADYMDFCGDWIDGYESDDGDSGFVPLFVMAIQQNEDGFYPEYFTYDGYGAVIYEDRQPWEMSERERNMS